MNFSEIFIRRPVLSIVLSLLILLMGLQGAQSLAVRQYPKIDETVIGVRTFYAGASAALIQGFITDPVSKAVASAEDVDYVTSSSSQSSSNVSVHMRLGTDPDKALTNVMTKVQSVRGTLPREAEDPVVTKGTGYNQPLLYIGFWSEKMNQQQIAEYLIRVVAPLLSTVPGVADARVIGSPSFAMRIWLDPMRLAAHNITAAEVTQAIQRSNFLSAPGKIKSELYAYAVETDTTLRTPEAFGMLPLRGQGNDVVRLRDVAKVELGPQNYDFGVRLEEGKGVFIGMFPTPAANPLDVAKGVHALFPSIKANLPPGLSAQIDYDGAAPIEASIHEVFVTMAEAVGVVILVILLFLGSARTVLIPTVTIPLSLVGVCFVLSMLGYSINLLTLLAMVLAIGLVVDDAIVVVENVHRHLALGQKPREAAIAAMKEILGPVVAMTITLAAVYAPIGFVQGLTGALFREFAFALAGAVIISGFIAVTLSPMMSARILKHEDHDRHRRAETFPAALARKRPAFARAMLALRNLVADLPEYSDRSFAWLAERYQALLRSALALRGSIVLLSGLVLLTAAVLFMRTPSELAPKEDEGFAMTRIMGPRYATTPYMEDVLNRFNAAVGKLPDTQTTFSIVGGFGGPNSVFHAFVLKPWSERRPISKIVDQIQKAAGTVPGAQIAVFPATSLPGASDGFPVQYVIRSTASFDHVYDVAQQIRAKAMQSGRFMMLENSATYDAPQVRIEVDRERAATLGVSVSDIGSTLSTLMSEGWVSRFDRDDHSYQVIPQVSQLDRYDPESMGHFYVRSHSGDMVPLSALVKIATKAGPQSIDQFNQLNAATIGGVPTPGTTLGEAIDTLRNIAHQVMPDGFFEDFTGQARLSQQEGSSLGIAFIFAVIVIYLVLAAQFESFRDPLIIMTAVPLSIFGALVPLNIGSMIFLRVNGASLNIYTQLGLITLVGLIAKHGILLVQFANDRRAAGVPLEEAIIESARVRLRPILMTTAAMVMGVVPLLFASGAGAAARFAIGLVIASGMAIGTCFTLFVVPVFYTYIARKDSVLAALPAEAARPIAPEMAGEEERPLRRAL
jgi:multidrug efflux pump